jgi:hypothetical protein
VRWGTTTSKLEGRATSFVCTAPVLIVMNKLPHRDPDVLAILDRCDAIFFKPTKREVIARMRAIFPENEDLVDLVAELPAMPSLRTLVKARRWQKSRHLNLIEELLAECCVPAAVAQLAQIMEALPEQDWCDQYIAATGLTDRTYRRHKQLARQLVEWGESQNPCPNVPAVKPIRRAKSKRCCSPPGAAQPIRTHAKTTYLGNQCTRASQPRSIVLSQLCQKSDGQSRRNKAGQSATPGLPIRPSLAMLMTRPFFSLGNRKRGYLKRGVFCRRKRPERTQDS